VNIVSRTLPTQRLSELLFVLARLTSLKDRRWFLGSGLLIAVECGDMTGFVLGSADYGGRLGVDMFLGDLPRGVYAIKDFVAKLPANKIPIIVQIELCCAV
jgi:hypothetical protein